MNFDPTVDSLSSNQILYISQKSPTGLQVRNKKCHANALIHYLSKIWRWLTEPCTRMKSVWQEMYFRGVELYAALPVSAEKAQRLRKLKINLESFERIVIGQHNERRFSWLVGAHLAGIKILGSDKAYLSLQEMIDASTPPLKRKKSQIIINDPISLEGQCGIAAIALQKTTQEPPPKKPSQEQTKLMDAYEKLSILREGYREFNIRVEPTENEPPESYLEAPNDEYVCLLISDCQKALEKLILKSVASDVERLSLAQEKMVRDVREIYEVSTRGVYTLPKSVACALSELESLEAVRLLVPKLQEANQRSLALVDRHARRKLFDKTAGDALYAKRYANENGISQTVKQFLLSLLAERKKIVEASS